MREQTSPPQPKLHHLRRWPACSFRLVPERLGQDVTINNSNNISVSSRRIEVCVVVFGERLLSPTHKQRRCLDFGWLRDTDRAGLRWPRPLNPGLRLQKLV